MAIIYYGHSNGETKVVLDKAIRICMECIGIG
ncbi:CD1871A family CXXC motif-containing protein [Anaerostipes hadrus]